MRFTDVDTDGHVIRIIRCTKCGSIVARIYGDIEVRFRAVAVKPRRKIAGHGDSPIVENGCFLLDQTDEEITEWCRDGYGGARCQTCTIGYHTLDVRDAARILVRSDRRSTKLLQRRDTL